MKVLRAWGFIASLTFVLAGIYVLPARAAACAPTTTISGAYTVVQFQSTGTCTYTFPTSVTRVEYLVLGGGGGGGNNAGDGGGGGSYYMLTRKLLGQILLSQLVPVVLVDKMLMEHFAMAKMEAHQALSSLTQPHQ